MPAAEDPYASACQGLLESLGCAFRSLQIPACTRLLGPLVPGATLTQGARVPGTSYELDPAMAAFNLGTMMGWSGCRGYPADKLAAILPVADYLARKAHNEARAPLCVRDVLAAMIEAQRIRHQWAAAAVVTRLLGGSPRQIAIALCADRHPALAAPAGRWAAGEAAARAVRLAFVAINADPSDEAVLHASAAPAPAMPETPGADGTGADGTGADGARGDGAAGPLDLFADSVAGHFPAAQVALIRSRIANRATLITMPVHEFIALLVKNG
ncbi:MAG: MmgE/PrpD family protein [Steroidobacterales bacterium]